MGERTAFYLCVLFFVFISCNNQENNRLNEPSTLNNTEYGKNYIKQQNNKKSNSLNKRKSKVFSYKSLYNKRRFLVSSKIKKTNQQNKIDFITKRLKIITPNINKKNKNLNTLALKTSGEFWGDKGLQTNVENTECRKFNETNILKFDSKVEYIKVGNFKKKLITWANLQNNSYFKKLFKNIRPNSEVVFSTDGKRIYALYNFNVSKVIFDLDFVRYKELKHLYQEIIVDFKVTAEHLYILTKCLKNNYLYKFNYYNKKFSFRKLTGFDSNFIWYNNYLIFIDKSAKFFKLKYISIDNLSLYSFKELFFKKHEYPIKLFLNKTNGFLYIYSNYNKLYVFDLNKYFNNLKYNVYFNFSSIFLPTLDLSSIESLNFALTDDIEKIQKQNKNLKKCLKQAAFNKKDIDLLKRYKSKIIKAILYKDDFNVVEIYFKDKAKLKLPLFKLKTLALKVAFQLQQLNLIKTCGDFAFFYNINTKKIVLYKITLSKLKFLFSFNFDFKINNIFYYNEFILFLTDNSILLYKKINARTYKHFKTIKFNYPKTVLSFKNGVLAFFNVFGNVLIIDFYNENSFEADDFYVYTNIINSMSAIYKQDDFEVIITKDGYLNILSKDVNYNYKFNFTIDFSDVYFDKMSSKLYLSFYNNKNNKLREFVFDKSGVTLIKTIDLSSYIVRVESLNFYKDLKSDVLNIVLKSKEGIWILKNNCISKVMFKDRIIKTLTDKFSYFYFITESSKLYNLNINDYKAVEFLNLKNIDFEILAIIKDFILLKFKDSYYFYEKLVYFKNFNNKLDSFKQLKFKESIEYISVNNDCVLFSTPEHFIFYHI